MSIMTYICSNLEPIMKELRWIASAKDDLLALPAMVVREIGHALYLAQLGTEHSNTKPLRGFGDAGVLEVVEDFDGNTFRAVSYTHLRAHETDSYLVCRLLLEKKKKNN